MKMFSLFTALLLASSAQANTLKVDTAGSKLDWTGSKVTGKHNGAVSLKEGSLDVEKGTLKAGHFVIDLNTITNVDLTDAATNAKLLGHLKSEDFFDVAKFPTAEFKVTKVEALKGAKAGGPTHTITGDLTLKGVTKPVSFPATVTVGKDSTEAVATIKVDRTLFGLKYGSGKFFQGLGDKMISDEFALDVKLTAKADAPAAAAPATKKTR